MNSKSRLFGLVVLVCLFFSTVPLLQSIAATNHESAVKHGLYRLDFRIEGKSCAACLLSTQRKLNSLPGVKQAVVMLKRPFGVSVIYEPDQIKQDDILAVVKDKQPHVKVLEISEISVQTLPSPLIPPFVPTKQEK